MPLLLKKIYCYVIWSIRAFLVKKKKKKKGKFKETSSQQAKLPRTPPFAIFESLTFATICKPSLLPFPPSPFPLTYPVIHSLWFLSTFPGTQDTSSAVLHGYSNLLLTILIPEIPSQCRLCTAKRPPSVSLMIHGWRQPRTSIHTFSRCVENEPKWTPTGWVS